MPDCCDQCDSDAVCLPFTVRSDEHGWAIAHYNCESCGALWAVGWSTVLAIRMNSVSGGEMWERDGLA
jgi:hypothetical protein